MNNIEDAVGDFATDLYHKLQARESIDPRQQLRYRISELLWDYVRDHTWEPILTQVNNPIRDLLRNKNE